MNQTVSVYLNLVRLCAALVVVLAHIPPVLFPNASIPAPGHEAVVVFFVMSGYVIGYASSEREKTLQLYAFSRLTRIYSVAIPALLLGAILSHYVPHQVGDAFPLQSNWQQVTGAVVANALFLGQSWFGDVAAPLSSAYWSLNYEAWYYAVFAAWFYLRPGLRWPICLVLAVLAGPKIMALFPCWALGVALYRWQDKLTIAPKFATALLLLSVATLAGLFVSGFDAMARSAISTSWPSYPQFMGGSNKAPTDLLVAVCFAASVVAISNGAWPSRLLLKLKASIEWGADRTLSIYLFHAPVFAFLYSALHLRGWLAIFCEVAAVLILAEMTELRLRWFRSILRSVLPQASRLDARPVPRANHPLPVTTRP